MCSRSTSQSLAVMTLNGEQQNILDLVMGGQNIFITGGAGVGKTFLINTISQSSLLRLYKKIAVTSTTGTSSILINGTTLHSYLGIGIGTNSVGAIHTTIMKKKYLREKEN